MKIESGNGAIGKTSHWMDLTLILIASPVQN